MLVSLASLIIIERLATTTTTTTRTTPAATSTTTAPPLPTTIITISNQITFNLNYLLNKLSNILKLYFKQNYVNLI